MDTNIKEFEEMARLRDLCGLYERRICILEFKNEILKGKLDPESKGDDYPEKENYFNETDEIVGLRIKVLKLEDENNMLKETVEHYSKRIDRDFENFKKLKEEYDRLIGKEKDQ